MVAQRAASQRCCVRWRRPLGDLPPPTRPPTQVWDVSSGACVLELHQKSVTKESWPVLQWGAGDGGVWHAVTNTLHCYGRAEGFKGARAGSACAVDSMPAGRCGSVPLQRRRRCTPAPTRQQPTRRRKASGLNPPFEPLPPTPPPPPSCQEGAHQGRGLLCHRALCREGADRRLCAGSQGPARGGEHRGRDGRRGGHAQPPQLLPRQRWVGWWRDCKGVRTREHWQQSVEGSRRLGARAARLTQARTTPNTQNAPAPHPLSASTMMWNTTATACLFMATSDTDATNQSYYGESKVGVHRRARVFLCARLHLLPARVAAVARRLPCARANACFQKLLPSSRTRKHTLHPPSAPLPARRPRPRRLCRGGAHAQGRPRARRQVVARR